VELAPLWDYHPRAALAGAYKGASPPMADLAVYVSVHPG
jgi:hypothetical protein